MHPSPEITLDMTAEDLLKTLSNDVDDSCFEVDDISSVDPLDETHPVAPRVADKATNKATKIDALADDEDTIEFDSLEIELSASDMNALLQIELPQQAAEPAAPTTPAPKADNG
jgi:hypothetical protein